jgi:putative SOS response-associated peptidase YedK
MYIQMESRDPFAFAGLWESWRSPEGETVLSCTIITTEPNELMTTIHNRMPVILPSETYEQWLDPAEQKAEQLQGLLKPYPAELMVAYPISTLVNNPSNDMPDCIAPLAEA